MSKKKYIVTAPISGTFYVSPYPEDPPYVCSGQKVNAGDVVGIIESMKIFNELSTKKSGSVVKILVNNEDAVMKDQAIMEIEEK